MPSLARARTYVRLRIHAGLGCEQLPDNCGVSIFGGSMKRRVSVLRNPERNRHRKRRERAFIQAQYNVNQLASWVGVTEKKKNKPRRAEGGKKKLWQNRCRGNFFPPAKSLRRKIVENLNTIKYFEISYSKVLIQFSIDS